MQPKVQFSTKPSFKSN